MNTTLYIDKGKPFAQAFPETLSDGSKAWNVTINGREIPCISEQGARDIVMVLAAMIQKHSNETILVL